jgi:hypothetical protein
MLTITRVAPEYQDTAGPTHLCRDTLMRILTKMAKGHMERGTRGKSSLAVLRPTRWVALCHRFLGIVSPEIKGRTLPLESWVCWLAFLVARPHRAD